MLFVLTLVFFISHFYRLSANAVRKVKTAPHKYVILILKYKFAHSNVRFVILT